MADQLCFPYKTPPTPSSSSVSSSSLPPQKQQEHRSQATDPLDIPGGCPPTPPEGVHSDAGPSSFHVDDPPVSDYGDNGVGSHSRPNASVARQNSSSSVYSSSLFDEFNDIPSPRPNKHDKNAPHTFRLQQYNVSSRSSLSSSGREKSQSQSNSDHIVIGNDVYKISITPRSSSSKSSGTGARGRQTGNAALPKSPSPPASSDSSMIGEADPGNDGSSRTSTKEDGGGDFPIKKETYIFRVRNAREAGLRGAGTKAPNTTTTSRMGKKGSGARAVAALAVAHHILVDRMRELHVLKEQDVEEKKQKRREKGKGKLGQSAFGIGAEKF